MREIPFLCRVYICKSAKQEGRGGEHSPPLILYVEKGEGKGGCPEGGWKGISIYDCIDFARVSFSSQ
jgi:hypothetical protein